jgi:hypothetical protein
LAAKNRHELVEDVEHMLSGYVGHMLSTDTPRQILDRLGRSAAAVERGLLREGRPDLARPFARLRWEERRAAGWVRPVRDRRAA